MKFAFAAAALAALAAAPLAAAHDHEPTPREALMQALEGYTPGAPVTEAITAPIDAAARALEASAPSPDLAADPTAADGFWVSLFSSQGIVGEVPVAFMTRALPGGGVEAGAATVTAVFQELRVAERFYRNTMLMTAGPDATPILYVADADVTVDAAAPQDLQVRFVRITFAPARAGDTLAEVRAALGLPDGAPLAAEIALTPERPASTSTVTYLDDDLRVNRGRGYVAVLRRVQ